MRRAIGLDQLCTCDGPSCPLIAVVDASGATILQTQCAFAEAFLGTTASQKWVELGWASLAIAVMLVMALLATRFCNFQRK